MAVGRRRLVPLWTLALALACTHHTGQAQQGPSESSYEYYPDLPPLEPGPGGNPLGGVTIFPPLKTTVTSKRALNPAHNGRVCSTWGDFHYKTFDGDIFRFPGLCNYVLASHCRAPYEDFNVQLRRGPGANGTTPSRVVLKLDGMVLELTESSVLVNGHPVQLPFSQAGVLIERNSMYLKVRARLGLVFLWNPDNSLLLELDDKYANQTCGLCGDFNGLPVFSEFLSNNIKLTPTEYGNLQKMDGPTEQCQDPAPTPLRNCTSGLEFCQETLLSQPFSACHALVDPGSYIEACQQDICLCTHDDPTSCACPTLAEYARQCVHAGGVPQDWRTSNLCPAQTCPFNMEHQECGLPCPNTCSNLEHAQLCEDHCVSGCFCPQGTVFDDISQNGCVPVSQCSCTYNGIPYPPGAVYSTDCTSCTCSGGRWSCQESPCPGTCSVLGGSHVSTFDEKQYTVHGDCSYVLAKPCDGGAFTVLAELRKCGLTDSETCLKSVTLSLGGGQTVVVVKASGEVFVNQIYTQLPVSAANLTLFRPSTFFVIAQTALGLQLDVQLVPTMQVFLRLAPALRGLTCGLCGNFNSIQADDFQTISGVVEGTAAAFANTWKTQAACPNVKNTFEDPCSLSVENEKYAQYWCSRLTDPKGRFAQCHATVNPATYYSNCMFDTCNCEKSEACLCSALSAYVRACAAKGVLLSGWREGACAKSMTTCPKSLNYSDHVSTCQPTCRSLSEEDPTCHISFVPVDGCVCTKGTYLDDSGKCVPAASCPCYHQGVTVPSGESVHEGGAVCTCTHGKLTCIGIQAPTPACAAPMVYFDCRNATPGASGAGCQKSCHTLDMACYSSQCVSGCVCPNGLVADGEGGCIAAEDCPCVHNEASYKAGQTIHVGCNTCTCKNRMWQCTQEPCLATCAVYGDGHYLTFDGQRFSFDGDCEYTLVQDHCSSNSSVQGSFRVVTENVPCGTTGTTCSKAIKIFLGSYELKLSDGNVEVIEKGAGQGLPYFIRQMGIYLVVDTDVGLVLQWDKKTSLFLRLSPEFKGKVCGLCGNFDGNAINDFTTRSQSVVGDVLEFGNSWKFSPTCPDALAPRDPCIANPYRKAWAQKQCSILHSATFAACHAHVEPTKYYEACVSDACACDSGGDCECFCTAVAAYAQACHDAGVCVSWRSPEVCPLFCDYYNPQGECEWHYQPCGAPCMRTCRNPSGRCLHDLRGLEGCYPKCPPEAPIFDEEEMQCVAQCSTPPPPPPCRVRGKDYRPGVAVPSDQNCQTCACTEHGVVCVYNAEACVCTYDGQHFRPGDIIYHTSDGTGSCISARCVTNGTIERTVQACGTSTVPPTTTFSFSTSSGSHTPPVVIPVTNWTFSTPPGSSPPPTHMGCRELCTWTPWLDASHPGRGIDSGDFDTLQNLRDHGFRICRAPKEVQCRAEARPHVPLAELGQHVECSRAVGLTCYNRAQASGLCDNYQIRVQCCSPEDCPLPPSTAAPPGPAQTTATPTPVPGTWASSTMRTTTSRPTTQTQTATSSPAVPSSVSCMHMKCSWSEWIDGSYPKPGRDGGDFDTFQNLRSKGYDICQQPAEVQCRAERYPDTPLALLGQVVTCSNTTGLLCLNKDQLPPICLNYEIRVRCCHPVNECMNVTTAPVPTATSASTPPTTLVPQSRTSTPVSTTTVPIPQTTPPVSTTTTTSPTPIPPTTSTVPTTTTTIPPATHPVSTIIPPVSKTTTTTTTTIPPTTHPVSTTSTPVSKTTTTPIPPTTSIVPPGTPTVPPATTTTPIPPTTPPVSITTPPVSTTTTTTSTTIPPAKSTVPPVTPTVPETTHSPCPKVCTWTKWFDVDFPSSGLQGGDVETYDNIVRHGEKVCHKPEAITQLQCRAENHPEVSIERLGQVVECNPDVGLVCRNQDQMGKFPMCFNYEIRVLCCEPRCHTPATPSTTVPPATSTVPPATYPVSTTTTTPIPPTTIPVSTTTTTPIPPTTSIVPPGTSTVPPGTPTVPPGTSTVPPATYPVSTTTTTPIPPTTTPVSTTTTTPIPPTTSIVPPGTSTVPPGTPTVPPSTSTVPPGTHTVPRGTSTVPPATYPVSTTTTTPIPPTTIPVSTTTTTPIPPTTSIVPPGTSTVPPGTPTVPPGTSTVPPATSPVSTTTTTPIPPTTSIVPPGTPTVPPATTTTPIPPTTPPVSITTPPVSTTTTTTSTTIPPAKSTVPPVTPTVPETTHSLCPKVCTWTKWFDVDFPSSGLQGGDVETYDNIIRHGEKVCHKPEAITQLQCRAENHPEVSIERLGQVVECNPDVGLVCRNQDQMGKFPMCFNYEIRVLCCEPRCHTPATSSTTVPPATSTVPPATTITPIPPTTPPVSTTTPPVPTTTTTTPIPPATSTVPPGTSTVPPATSPVSTTTTTPIPPTTTPVSTTTTTPIPPTTSIVPPGTPTVPPATTTTPIPPTTPPVSITTPPVSTTTTTTSTTIPPAKSTVPPVTPTVPETTHSPCPKVCTWTKWFDVDFPSSGLQGGDVETYDNIVRHGEKVCHKPEAITQLQCRAKNHPEVSIERLGQVVECNPDVGLVCRNQDQMGKFPMCFNYEIRVLCCEPRCHTPATSSTIAPPATSTVPPATSTVPPGTPTVPPGTHTVPRGTSTVPPATSPVSTTTTTPIPPTTSIVPPGTSTVPPGTPTVPPGTSTVPPGTHTVLRGTSTVPPATSPVSTTTTTPIPPTTTPVSTTTTTPIPPTTSIVPPGTSTVPPGTPTVPPSTSTVPPGTHTVPRGTSTVPPATYPVSTTTTTPIPPTTIPVSTTTTTPIPPTTSIVPPGTSTVPPGTPTVPPGTSTVPPATSPVSTTTTTPIPPTTSIVPPGTPTVPPATTTTPIPPTTPPVSITTPPVSTTTTTTSTTIPPAKSTVPPVTPTVPETTHSPCPKVCTWTKWFDVDFPSSGLQGGDVETYDNIVRHGEKVCHKPEAITQLQCRAENHPEVSIERLGQVVECNPDVGLVCRNQDQMGKFPMCFNYEIRVLCCEPRCHTPATPSTTVPPATSTVPPATYPVSTTTTTPIPPTTIPVSTTTTTPIPPTTSIVPPGTSTVPPGTPTVPPGTSTVPPATSPVSTTTTTPIPPTTSIVPPGTPTVPPATTTTPIPPTTPPVSITTPPVSTTTTTTSTTIPPAKSTVPPVTPTVPETTHSPCPKVCRWTKWFDVDFPSSGLQGGDVETYDNIVRHGEKVCHKPEAITQLQCRAKNHPEVSIERLGQVVECNPDVGLVCRNQDQMGKFPMCFNYEIRVLCCEPRCHTPATSSTTVPPATSTVPPATTITPIPPTTPHVSTTTPPVPTTTTTTPIPPATSTVPPVTPTVPPGTSTVPPATSPVSITTTTPIPPTTTPVSTTTPPVPTTTTTTPIPPATSTVPPVTPTVPPGTSTVPPATSPVSTTTTTPIPPTTTPVSTTTTTPIPPTTSIVPPGTPTVPPATTTTPIPPTTPPVPTTTTTTTTPIPPATSTVPPATSPVPETTHSPCPTVCTWTKWFDVDFPSSGLQGGDVETYDNIVRHGEKVCHKPEAITQLQCRAENHPEVSIERLGQVVECNPDVGLVCRNQDQMGKFPMCFNYEIRVLCCEPQDCPPTSVTPSVPAPSTPQTPHTSPPVTILSSTTQCYCAVAGKFYPAGATIYQQRDLDGHCYSAQCTQDCHVVKNASQDCPPTTPPPTPPPSPSPSANHMCSNVVPPRKKGETWNMPGCTQATCEGHDVITLHPRTCPPSKALTCANGYPPMTVMDKDGCCPHQECQCVCSGWGDPHYITFDGTYYTFLDNCTYVLVQQIVPRYGHFRVLIDNYFCNAEDGLSCPRSIILEYQQDRVVLTRRPGAVGISANQILFNGKQVQPGFRSNGIVVSQLGIKMFVSVPAIGLQVMFTGLIFSVEVPVSKFDGNTEGQCGTCSNNQKDDCRLPDGALDSSCSRMAGHWKVTTPNQPFCLRPPSTPMPTTTPSTWNRCKPSLICQLILSKVFEHCHDVIPPRPYYEGCVFDQCHVDDVSVMCSSLEMYASLCASHGRCIDWRGYTNNTCAFTCPPDQVYEPCGPISPTYCYGNNSASINALQDFQSSTEGCFCPAGLTLFSESIAVCVPTDCPSCQGPNGEPVEPGQTIVANCQECTCDGSTRTLSCRAQTCPAPPSCHAAGHVAVPVPMQEGQCCTEYHCVCNSSSCPQLLPCPQGSHAVITHEEGQCCPSRTCIFDPVCVYNGSIYQPGAVVSSSLCKTCRCQAPQDPATEPYMVICETQICKRLCQPGFEYRELAGQCCGTCVPVACVIHTRNGSVHLFYPNETWTDPEKPCETHECERHPSGPAVVTTKKACPVLDCPQEQAQLGEDGCCLQCPHPFHNMSTCAVYYKQEVIQERGCRSLQPLHLPYCKGNCGDTASIYSFKANKMEHRCQCCRELRTSLRNVTLSCGDGSTRAFSYRHVEQCGCVGPRCDSEDSQEDSQEAWASSLQ